MGIIYFGNFQYFDENIKINLDRTNDASSRVESDQFSLSSHIETNHFSASNNLFALGSHGRDHLARVIYEKFIQNLCNFLCLRFAAFVGLHKRKSETIKLFHEMKNLFLTHVKVKLLVLASSSFVRL